MTKSSRNASLFRSDADLRSDPEVDSVDEAAEFNVLGEEPAGNDRLEVWTK